MVVDALVTWTLAGILLAVGAVVATDRERTGTPVRWAVGLGLAIGLAGDLLDPCRGLFRDVFECVLVALGS